MADNSHTFQTLTDSYSASSGSDADSSPIEDTKNRVCYKCLMRDMKGDETYYANLDSYIAAIEPDKKTPADLYDERLAICESCDRLLQGMCRACGCYVELRAATAMQKCPYNKW